SRCFPSLCCLWGKLAGVAGIGPGLSCRSQKAGSPKSQAEDCSVFQLQASSSRFPARYVLTTQTQTTDQGAVTSSILALQVIQQLTTLVDHTDQATTGVVVLAVGLEVALQLVDVGGQQGNLHFRATGIAFSLLVLVNDLGFFSNAKSHDSLITVNRPVISRVEIEG